MRIHSGAQYHIKHPTSKWPTLWCPQRMLCLTPVSLVCSSPAGEERGLFDDLQEDEVEVLKQMFFGVILCALATLAAKGDMMFTSVFIGAVAAMVAYWLSDKSDRLLDSFLKGRWSAQEDKEDRDWEQEEFNSLAWKLGFFFLNIHLQKMTCEHLCYMFMLSTLTSSFIKVNNLKGEKTDICHYTSFYTGNRPYYYHIYKTKHVYTMQSEHSSDWAHAQLMWRSVIARFLNPNASSLSQLQKSVQEVIQSICKFSLCSRDG